DGIAGAVEPGEDLALSEGAPHGRDPGEPVAVVVVRENEPAAEIRSRPSAEQFGTFRGSTAGCLESPNRLVARLGFRLQAEGEHELHRTFPMSLRGPSLTGPCAQVRASSHGSCILRAT